MKHLSITLFVHARPRHTQITIESLLKNPEATDATLHVFSDGARDLPGEAEKVHQVREYVRSIHGFREVVLHESAVNLGLAASIIAGVDKVLETAERVIVLEDDLMFSCGFLAYMNQALDFYANYRNVLSISGYSYPIRYPATYPWDVSFGLRASSWGWATWRDRWQAVDWNVSDYRSFAVNPMKRWRFNRGGSDLSRMLARQQAGRINSWAIRFCYHQFCHGMVDVFPRRSLVENIGWGDGASHCIDDVRAWKTDFWQDPPAHFRFPEVVEVDSNIARSFRSFNSLRARTLRTLYRWLHSLKRRV